MPFPHFPQQLKWNATLPNQVDWGKDFNEQAKPPMGTTRPSSGNLIGTVAHYQQTIHLVIS